MLPVVVNLRTPALLMPGSVVVKAVAMHSRLILQYAAVLLHDCCMLLSYSAVFHGCACLQFV
jgi:hypothetical protein